MLMAVGLSLLALLQRFSEARVARLGRLPGTHDFVDFTRTPQAETDPQILVVRPMEPLFFANAERVLATVSNWVDADAAIRVVILSVEESPDFDSSALDALLEFYARLHTAGRHLLLARVKEDIRDLLRAAGADRLAGEQNCFWSVADAFVAATARKTGIP
jgi:anti-anti-sigma factor